MRKFSRANIRKSWRYLRRNGIVKTYYAVRERLTEEKKEYRYEPPKEEELAAQRRWAEEKTFKFSILVPAYRTREAYLKDMIRSLQVQSYPHWELILADATEDDRVERAAKETAGSAFFRTEQPQSDKAAAKEHPWQDGGIYYVRLTENGGISENTNRALAYAAGDYVGLLDHDDVLTADALYWMARNMEKGQMDGEEKDLLYSDEDKCSSSGTEYYEPHLKEDFNLDLLFTNNYICHFLVMKRDLIVKLKLRRAFEGAQDYDLVLRAVRELGYKDDRIAHVPRVLYHWRCHAESTAENPDSKDYAYEAGRRALDSLLNEEKCRVEVRHMEHRGYYRVLYLDGIFHARKDLAACGGTLYADGRRIGGRLSRTGELYYEDLPANFGGYMHRAALYQDAEALDIRLISVRPELWEVFEQAVGVPYKETGRRRVFDASTLPADADYKALSLALAGALHKKGYRLLYMPDFTAGWSEKHRRLLPYR